MIILPGYNVGAYYAQINADWQRKSIIDGSPKNSLPYAYIDGYKMIADTVMEQLSPLDPRLDLFVYPLFFLYRQFIELLLKRIYMNTHSEAEQQNMIRTCGHNLDKLLNINSDRIHQIIKAQIYFDNGGKIAEDQLQHQVSECFSYISTTIQELAHYDQGSFAFRYNYNRDLSESIPNQLTVNLDALKKFTDLLCNLFYGEYGL